MDISRAFHLAPETPNIEGAYKEVWNHYHFTPQDTMLTLQQKQLNMIAEQIAVEHLAAEAAAANVPPPRLAMPQSSLTQPQQVGISQPAPQNIQQIQQLQTQQALQGSR